MVHSSFLAYLSSMTIFFYNLSSSFLWPTSTSYTFYFIIYAFFSPNHSHPLLKHTHTILTYVTVLLQIAIISTIPSLFFNSMYMNLSVILTPHIHLIISSQPAEVSIRSLSSLTMFYCHVTYNYAHNLCIISLS